MHWIFIEGHVDVIPVSVTWGSVELCSFYCGESQLFMENHLFPERTGASFRIYAVVSTGEIECEGTKYTQDT